ncbi:v-type proton ATPase 16 kDa proteolipid subunit 2 [Schaereria dolodes]|nr:v-type proton ATPase 16 kDa proteolipid subunit 2 [Schaereria dolodes]
MAEDELAPKFAPFFGMGGIAFAMIFGCAGAAYGTAKSGIGIAGVGTFRPDLIMKVQSSLQPGPYSNQFSKIPTEK